MSEIKTVIEHDGQPYVDDPIYAHPKPVSAMEGSIGAAFNNLRKQKAIVTGYERVKLRWLKPDGKGGLIPR